MKNQTYQIGTFHFALAYEPDGSADALRIPANYKKFTVSGDSPGYTYHISVTERIKPPAGTPACIRPDLQVFSYGKREERYLFFAGSREPYGSYVETDGENARVQIRQDCLTLCIVDTVFTALLALERHLLAHGTLILHCAAVDVGEKSLLLSGPSGIGKSTHAGLWERYAHAKQVNGDRILLRKDERGWQTAGFPVCGSSGICENRTLPLFAVVFLSQSPTNQGTRLAPTKALHRFISQITVNRWSPESVSAAWDIAAALIGDVPVFSYGCNMEPEAVSALQKLLQMP